MKYGPLFRNYIEDFAHTPSTNRCTTLPYTELKQMAKNMYPTIKSDVRAHHVRNNPLVNYMRMPKQELAVAVYEALNLMY
jgi:hypothetical protein